MKGSRVCLRSSSDDAIHEMALAEEHGDVEGWSRVPELPWLFCK